LILEKIPSITLLADLWPRAPTISEDEPIITYSDASNIPTSPVRVELLQLTAPEQGSDEDIEKHTPFPLSIKEDIFIYDIGNLSKASTCDMKGLNVKPAEQDLEGFIASQENLLDLSAIISRYWIEVVEEGNSYIKVFPNPKIICSCLQGFKSWKACYDPRVGVNIPLMDEAYGVDLQPLVPSMKILQGQLGMNLQCRGVVPITIENEGSKVCLEYHIFCNPGPTFVLIGVPIHALLRGADNGEHLKLAIRCIDLSTSFFWSINRMAEEELEEDPL
jgi:hypothetical protein